MPIGTATTTRSAQSCSTSIAEQREPKHIDHIQPPLLRSREAGRDAILYAFDHTEHDGEDMRNRPFLDRKNALARLLRNTEAGILFNEHIVEDGPTVFAHTCRLGAVDPACAASGSRSAIRAAPGDECCCA
jgi:hypothetical protein